MIRVIATLLAGLVALTACHARQAPREDMSGAQASPSQAVPPPATPAAPLPAEQKTEEAVAQAMLAEPSADKPDIQQDTRKAIPAEQHARMHGAPSAKSKAPPGGGYRKVSELVRFPDFYPGLGQLWVDPAALPVGPFRAYDRKGELVSTILMVPLKDLNAHETREAIQGTPEPVNHIDMHFTEGHPGVDEPHYHIILWHVPKERVATLR